MSLLQVQRAGVDEAATGRFKVQSWGDGTGGWGLLNKVKDQHSESQHLQESELGGMGSEPQCWWVGLRKGQLV